MIESWEKSKGKRKKYTQSIIIGGIVIILIVTVLNNSDVITDILGLLTNQIQKKNTGLNKVRSEKKSILQTGAIKEENFNSENDTAVQKIPADSLPVFNVAESEKNSLEEKEYVMAPNTSIEKKINSAYISEKALLSMRFKDIQCNLFNIKHFFLKISFDIYFKGTDLQDEILLKREDIRIQVKKVFLSKGVSDIVVKPLKREITFEINKVLKKGKIKDIDFIEFMPVAY